MADSDAVAEHYTHGRLLDAILAGVTALGKTPETVGIEDLAPVDEFHIGGRQATEDFVAQLELTSDDHVLDVGCGIGGTLASEPTEASRAPGRLSTAKICTYTPMV